MFYADTVGLKKVVEALEGYEGKHGDAFAVTPLLKRLADEGKGFKDL
jgi:3-hydroxyacyl-CoA dehydrogenase